MNSIDSLCGIILLAAGACVFFVIALAEGEGVGLVAAAVYASALCWIFTRVNNKFKEKDTEIENLKKQHAIKITEILNASRDKN